MSRLAPEPVDVTGHRSCSLFAHRRPGLLAGPEPPAVRADVAHPLTVAGVGDERRQAVLAALGTRLLRPRVVHRRAAQILIPDDQQARLLRSGVTEHATAGAPEAPPATCGKLADVVAAESAAHVPAERDASARQEQRLRDV